LLQAGAREEELSAAEAQLRAMQADLDLLRHQVSQGELKAPSDAVVRSRLMEPGELASAQRAVYSLALTQPKWIRVYVSELNLAAVQPGMAAQVLTDNNPGRAITGKVGYISSVAEFTPKSVQTEELRTTLVYEVRVLVQDPDNILRMGQPATVRLTRRTDTAR
jgi:HlyD family secretion protein